MSRLRSRSAPVIVVALFLAFAAAVARGADFMVNSTVDAIDAMPGDGLCATGGGACTVRAAGIEANQLSGADSIFIPAGTYTLTIAGAEEDDGLTGDLDVFAGVSIQGAGAGLTILDGGGIDTVLSLTSGTDSLTELSALTIAGGSVAGVNVLDRYPVSVGAVVISDCIIEHNLSAGVIGGGRSALTILRSALLNNGSGIYYGGSYTAQPELTISHSLISGNGSNGPGIYGWKAISISAVTLHISNTVIENNLNGGIGAGDSSVLVEDSLIRGSAGGEGIQFGECAVEIRRTSIDGNARGGVTNSYPGFGSLLIADSSIVRNSGTGGVSIGTFSADIENSTISQNSGVRVGGIDTGGIGSAVRVRNSTIVDNTGGTVGGIGIGASSAVLSGTLVARNSSSTGPSDCGLYYETGHTISSLGGNLIGNDSGCPFSAAPNDLVGRSWNPIDPIVGPLATNGGPTPTHALLSGSPALDVGGTSCLATDQRGVARPLDGNGNGLWACDIGAYEACPFAGNDEDQNGIPDACEDLNDSDGDGVADSLDNCLATKNTDQYDGDADGVGNECDNCVAIPNPRVPAGWQAVNGWAVLTGGQRDDDFDGYGNKCDGKFPGSLGVNVNAADTAGFKATIGKSREGFDCGLHHDLPCGIFDLDERATLNINAADTARYKQLIGFPPGPKCSTCPLTCEAGALRSCEP